MTDVQGRPIEYPKIETLLVRDEKTFKVTDVLRDPAFAIPARWFVTEKVDGTNIRVHYVPSIKTTYEDCYINEDGAASSRGMKSGVIAARVDFYGRTDKAQMQANLLEYLQATFPVEKFAAFPGPITLFGEGYGAKVQKGGGNYRPDSVSFRLFDVLAYGQDGHHWWLNWQNVVDIAWQLGIQTVPVLHTGATLNNIVLDVSRGLNSITAGEDSGLEHEAEGVVCRTDPYLLMRNGQRLVWKLKTKDF